MANIKISELNELTTKEYTDYIPIVDTSADETKKISVGNLIPSNVNLIAVSDTAPATYETGDKYFNTETNKIYTATSSGWANAEDPIENILYIVLEEKKSYTYDGETLVSVGGGSGSSDIVMVGTDTPTEDTKLYIESTDLDAQYEVIEDEYSTSEIKTNKVWIDGKPIYRKVIVLQTPASVGNSWTTVAGASISGLNISTIIDLKTLSDNNICWTGTISKISGGNLQLYNIGISGTDWYVKTLILEYTKGGNS